MFYVNDEFCKTTEYSKDEVLGCNCRFLQGPETEPESVEVICETLRQGIDCHVRVSNYKKSGSRFQNLLALRPVHDSNGVYRFVIGVQFEIDDGGAPPSKIESLGQFLELLPTTIAVTPRRDPRSTECTSGEYTKAKKGRNMVARLHAAMSGRKMMSAQQLNSMSSSHLFHEGFTKVLWLSNPQSAFQNLIEAPGGEAAFQRFAASIDELSTFKDWVRSGSSEKLVYILKTLFPEFVLSSECDEFLTQLRDADNVKRVPLVHLEEWVAMFTFATRSSSNACVLSDVGEAGSQVIAVNSAFTKLTGYTAAEMMGMNCTKLQGYGTESSAVQELMTAIRTQSHCTVQITNYKKTGEEFKNILSLVPVFSPTEKVRYMVGVMQEKGSTTVQAQTHELNFFLSAIPTSLTTAEDAQHFDKPLSKYERGVPIALDREEIKLDDVKYSLQISWMKDPLDFFNRMLTDPDITNQFRRYLRNNYSEAGYLLWSESQAMETFDAPDIEHKAEEIATKYLDDDYAKSGVSDSAAQCVRSKAQNVLTTLTMVDTPQFLRSNTSDAVLHNIINVCQGQVPFLSLIPETIQVFDDVAYWVHFFTSAVNSYPVSVVLSDMLTPGNPVIFANESFCLMTGYSKDEVEGNNCRFLQGPETEREAVASMRYSLSKGLDCHVKITNYRKSGEMFTILTSLRPIHDSNGVYRFCVGVHMEVSGALENTERLQMIFSSIPKTLDVGNHKPVGKYHCAPSSRGQPDVKAALHAALHGDKLVRSISYFPDSNQHYAENHMLMLKSLGISEEVIAAQMQNSQLASAVQHESWVDSASGWNARPADAVDQFNKIWFLRADADRAHVLKSILATTEGVISFARFLYLQSLTSRFIIPARVQQLLSAKGQDKHQIMNVFKSHLQANDQQTDNQDMLNALVSCCYLDFICSEFFNELLHSLKTANSSLLSELAQELLLNTGSVEGIFRLYPTIELSAESPPVLDFLRYFVTVAEPCRYALVLVDMSISAAPTVYVNSEFEKLTGYSKLWVTGQNCSFLQGPETQADDIFVLRTACRDGSPLAMNILNYTESGQPFENRFQMKPVRYTNGTLRFMIGMMDELKDNVTTVEQLREQDALMSMFPDSIEIADTKDIKSPEGQVGAHTHGRDRVDVEACMACMAQLLETDTIREPFKDFVKERYDLVDAIDLYTDVIALRKVVGIELHQRAQVLYAKYFDSDLTTSTDVMLSHLETAAINFTKGILLFDCFIAFASEPKTEYICRELRQPAMPQDADEWMALFAAVTEDFPLSINACDMTIAGLPLIHANNSFRSLTGYRSNEIIGQNCRFLQAVGTTEPDVTEKMRRTLQGGERNYVRLTNLKKNGTPFANLLSFFPIYDDSMLYRFMVCVQIDENCDQHELKKQLWLLERFERFLPSRLPVPSNVAAAERGMLIERTIYMDRRDIQASSGHNGSAGNESTDARASTQLDLSRWGAIDDAHSPDDDDGVPKKLSPGPAGDPSLTPKGLSARRVKGKGKAGRDLDLLNVETPGVGSKDDDTWATYSEQLTSRSETEKGAEEGSRLGGLAGRGPPATMSESGISDSGANDVDAFYGLQEFDHAQNFFFDEAGSAEYTQSYSPRDQQRSVKKKKKKKTKKRVEGATLKVPEPLFSDRYGAGGARAGGDHPVEIRGPSRPGGVSPAKRGRRLAKKVSPRNRRARPPNPASQSISSALASRFNSFYE
jgi:PAS domain S-box-containing protein